MREPFRYLASHCIPKRLYLHLFYLRQFGKLAHLRRPATLNEKLHWKKLQGCPPFHARVSDKYAVREWVAKRIGAEYLIPLLAVLERAEDLDLAAYPTPLIIKTTHGSGQNVIIRDDPSLAEDELKGLFGGWMKQNMYYLSKEPQYKTIKPRLVVEQLITDPEGNVPMDFKLHCFHGQVEAIQVDIGRFVDHRRNFYDVNWQLLPFTWSHWKKNKCLWPNGRAVERPAALGEMIGVARTLAQDFDYVRVDLYNCNGQVYFGELTLHPGGGWERFAPPGYDLFFGNKLDLEHTAG